VVYLARVQALTSQSHTPVQTKHQIHVFNTDLCAAFTNVIQSRVNDQSVSPLVIVQANLAVVRAIDRTYPGVRTILPAYLFFSWLVINLDKLVVFVKFTINLAVRYADQSGKLQQRGWLQIIAFV